MRRSRFGWRFLVASFLTIAAVFNSVSGVVYLIDPALVGENFRGFAPWLIGSFFLWGQLAWATRLWEEAA